MLPTLGIGDMNNLYKWLLNLNSVVMPLRYLWVFVAFIAVVRLAQKYKPEYVFIRNKPLAMTVGIWCFAFTAFACLTGIFPKMEAFTAEWTFQLALNVATPFVLVGLGLIFPDNFLHNFCLWTESIRFAVIKMIEPPFHPKFLPVCLTI